MAQPPSPAKLVTNPRIAKLIELEQRGVIKPQHLEELNTYRAQGYAPAAANLTGEERTSAFLATRVAGGMEDVGTALKDDPDAARPGFLASAIGFTDGMRKALSSSERKRVEDAQLDILDSALTLGTGAAYSKEQLAGYRSSYFPGYLDDEKEVAAKKVRLQRLLEAAKLKAGGAAPQIDQALAKLNVIEPDKTSATSNDPNAAVPGAKVEAPILEAGSSNILGTPSTGPRPTIDIHDETAAQTPEFRAGLAKLLANPSVGADEIRDYWGKNANGAPAPTTPAEAEKIAPLAVERGKNGVTDRIDAVARGLADVPSMGFADEIAAAGRTVFGNKTMAENLAAERGVDEYDQQNHGVLRFMGQLGGGAVLPFGEARTPGQLAKVGGAYGAAYGFGSGTGGLGDRFIHAGVGGASGLATGAAFGKLSELFNARPGPGGPPTTGNAVADAAARQDVPIIAADANPGARGVTSFLETVPGSTGLIRNRMQNTTDAIENRVADLTPEHIAPADRTGVGEQVQAGAQNWIRRSSDIGGRLYDRAYQLSDGAQATPTEMLSTIDTHLADLGRTPAANRQKIDALTTLRNDLVDAQGNPRPLDIDSLRNIRSGIREQMDAGNVRSSDLDRRLDEVMQAGRSDIQQSLSGNPRALSAFERADQFWSDRVQRVDNVMSKVIGKADDPISGEQVMAKIENMAAPRTGNADNLRTLLSSLRPDEREQVAANIAHALGRATPEAEFSAQRFFTQVNKLSPRARNAVFGQQGADALADLATIAEGRADTMARMNNSGSGRVSNWWRALRGTMGVGVGYGAATSPGITAATTATMLGGANVTARLLTNPTFARWMAQGFRASTSTAIENSINRLGTIASSQPAIRTEVLNLQSALAKAVNDNAPMMAKAAASNGEGPGNEQ